MAQMKIKQRFKESKGKDKKEKLESIKRNSLYQSAEHPFRIVNSSGKMGPRVLSFSPSGRQQGPAVNRISGYTTTNKIFKQRQLLTN